MQRVVPFSMRTAIISALLVTSAMLAVPALAQSAGLHSVSFADTVDRDGDGYYSGFNLDVEADTQCYGCYDEQSFGGNPEMEPFFRVVINDVDILNTDVVFRDSNYRGTVRVPAGSLEQFERQTLRVSIVLFDSDPVVDDIVDSWEQTIRYEPSSEDQTTPEPDEPTPEPEAKSTPQADARITEFEPPNGTYHVGEIAFANVTVKNEGAKSHTFFVGYGVIGPNGTIYDNGGTTGTPVTIPAGETRTVKVAWFVESEAPPGAYDTGTAVWKESDPTNLQTQLDEAVRNSTFVVTGNATDTE